MRLWFMSIREVVERICTRLGQPFEALVEMSEDRPAKDHAYLMDSSRARQELGWADQVDFDSGIDETIAWVKANYETMKQLPWDYIHKP